MGEEVKEVKEVKEGTEVTKTKKKMFCGVWNRGEECKKEEGVCDKIHMCRWCSKNEKEDVDHPVSKCTLAPAPLNKTCEVCNITFRGTQQSIDAHFVGKKHVKNSRKISFHCDLCDVDFVNPEERDSHLAGKRHQKEENKKNPQAQNAQKKAKVATPKATPQATPQATDATPADTANSKKRKQPNDTPTKPAATKKKTEAAKEKKVQEYAKTCIICDKKFIQAGDYDKHCVGKQHKRKLNQFRITETYSNGKLVKQYTCETCDNQQMHSEQELRCHLVTPQHVSRQWDKIKKIRTGEPATMPGQGGLPLLYNPAAAQMAQMGVPGFYRPNPAMQRLGGQPQTSLPQSSYAASSYQTPVSAPSLYQTPGYAAPSSSAGYSQSAASYQPPSTAYSQYSQQPDSAYSQPASAYSQPASAYSQPASAYSQPASAYSQPASAYSQSASAYSQPPASSYSQSPPGPSSYSQSSTPAPASSYTRPLYDPSPAAAPSSAYANSSYPNTAAYSNGGASRAPVPDYQPPRDYSQADSYAEYARVGAPSVPPATYRPQQY